MIYFLRVPPVVFLSLVISRVGKADKCQLPLAQGTRCDWSQPGSRWFYDGVTCERFNYTGCGGNANNFPSKAECSRECPGHIREDENLIRRIHGNVTVESSEPWENWTPDRAIDFRDSSESESCECCSGSKPRPAWWRINLGARYPIDKIIFIGRSDGGIASYQSRNFSMFDGFKDEDEGRSPGQRLIYKNNATRGHNFLIQFNPQLILQTVEITSPTELTICEIKFKESEHCPAGYFGQHCQEYCHCDDRQPCERLTGACQQPGCIPGWQGDSCNKKCDWGFYGDGCNRMCHCWNNASCNHISGNCSNGACAPGWKGLPTCSEECDWGSFGDRCAQRCHCYQNASCNNHNGTCLNGACEAGWRSHSCSKECKPATFGFDCRSACHCANNSDCNRFNGSCANNVCAPGWQGNNCSIECDEGYFGGNCSQVCHCLDRGKCRAVDGKCETGLCSAGWRGTSCSDECKPATFGFDCRSACHCANNSDCNRFNGSCANNVCAPGWQGNNCSIECDEGYFGGNCSQVCHCLDRGKCRAVDGKCETGLCSAGWRGTSCSDVCEPGTFGLDCQSDCHCANAKDCNHFNGSCVDNVCEAGWQGFNCSIACLPGTFGLDCNSVCHCANGVECDHANGSCPDNVCDSGWGGYNCSIELQTTSSEPRTGNPTGPVIGAIVGVIAAAVIIGAVIYWRRHKRSGTRKNDIVETTAALTSDRNQTEQSAPTELPGDKTTSIKLDKAIMGKPTKTEENIYCNYDKENKIPVYLLYDYLVEAYADRCDTIYQEFQQLPTGLTHDCTEAKQPYNARKNRYKDMYAYDHSRVILRRVDITLSTYINACYIDGYNTKKKFIASQGPTNEMVEDFWQMIFQENTSMIIMLTNVLENGSRKCIQYWPLTEDDEIAFGDVTVKTIKTATLPDYVIRELDVQKEGYVSRQITHAHFTAWPDKDVPDTPWHLVNFWRKIESMYSNDECSIVIHCSAGVGRTGTYIALDILLDQARAEGYIRPYSVVENMRQQRVHMVQTKAQYVFLHEAVAEALYTSPNPIKVNEYAIVFESLLQNDTTVAKTGLEQQFQLIQDNVESVASIEYSNFSSAGENDAVYANNTPDSIHLNANTQGICYLQNYLKQDAVVLAQFSDVMDTERLLKLLEEKKIRSVITIQDHENKGEQSLFDSKRRRSKIKIEHLETKKEKVYDEVLLVLKGRKSKTEEHNIKQFVYRIDTTESAISIGSTNAIQLLNAVLKWNASFEDDKTVLFTYKSAFGTVGILSLLLVEFERIRDREEVNLLETVHNMKQRNPSLLADYEHYKFCHEVVMEYIRQCDVYVNV